MNKVDVNSLSALQALKFFLIKERKRHQKDIEQIDFDLKKLDHIALPDDMDYEVWCEIAPSEGYKRTQNGYTNHANARQKHAICEQGGVMDEKKAYQWAAQALRNCNGEQHKREQCAELVAMAIERAYSHGYHAAEADYLEKVGDGQ